MWMLTTQECYFITQTFNMMNYSQDLLEDQDIKNMVMVSLSEKKNELSSLKERYNLLSMYNLQTIQHIDEVAVKKIYERETLEEKIMLLERDIRNIDMALKIHSGIYNIGEYEVLFEKAKQLDMKHVYELTTGEQVKRGNVCCIFHKERTPSMKIYEDSFHCFGCGAHGDVIDFVQKKNNCSHKEALEYLSKV